MKLGCSGKSRWGATLVVALVATALGAAACGKVDGDQGTGAEGPSGGSGQAGGTVSSGGSQGAVSSGGTQVVVSSGGMQSGSGGSSESGGADSVGGDMHSGEVPSEDPRSIPPFAIPIAPASGTLIGCDSIAAPTPVGVLADGRVVVLQVVSEASLGSGLIRAWDPRTARLQTLFNVGWSWTDVDVPIRVSEDGTRILELTTLTGGHGFRVYDVEHGGFTAPDAMPVDAVTASKDLHFVLDRNLRRFTAEGELDLDFAALLPRDATFWIPSAAGTESVALGNEAVAFRSRTLLDETDWLIIVVFEDGRVQSLAGASPPSRLVKLEFSGDGRYVLESSDYGLLVWDVETAQLVLTMDERGQTTFTGDEPRLLVAKESEVVERNLTGEVTFQWSLDRGNRGRNSFAIGPESIVGFEASGDLVAKTRTETLGTWPIPALGRRAGVAVTSDALFTMGMDLSDSSRTLVRFTPDHAGPTSTFSVPEAQDEWDGPVLLSPDERRVAAVFPDSVRILDAATLSLLATIPSGAGTVAWSPGGKYLATTPDVHYRDPSRPAYSLKKNVTLWDSSSGRVAARFDTPVVARGIAFSEDGKVLLGWGQEFSVEVVDEGTSAKGRLIFTLFEPMSDPSTFRVEVETGRTMANALGPSPLFIGSTRELVATAEGIFRVSTGERISVFPAPVPEFALFSGDSSLVAASRYGQSALLAVADGHVVAEAPSGPARAFSKDGRRIAIGNGVYCLHPQ